jgi:hypothetical protein
MDQDEWFEMFNRLQINYPYDYALINAIGEKYIRIRKKIFRDYDLNEGESKTVSLGISKMPGQPEPIMFLNDEAVALLAAITEVMAESFLRIMFSKEAATFFDQRARQVAEELILAKSPQIQEQNFKRCKHCQLDNDWNADFCKRCGKKL